MRMSLYLPSSELEWVSLEPPTGSFRSPLLFTSYYPSGERLSLPLVELP